MQNLSDAQYEIDRLRRELEGQLEFMRSQIERLKDRVRQLEEAHES